MAGNTYIFGSVLLICLSLTWIVEMSEVVSKDRPTAQSSDYTHMGTPIHLSGNAVDGNTNQMLARNSCAHQAAGEKEVWWRVDLQREVFVEQVTIYYRDEGFLWSGWKDRFAGYEVYLSNTTERHREERCFIDVTQYSNHIRSEVNHPECNGTARYVTIYNHRETPKRKTWYSENAVLELCEVNVYGCEAGRYGIGNCNNNCSSNCPGSLCHSDSGYCLYCGDNTYRRYQETFCRPCPESCAGLCDSSGYCTECKEGFYGYQCKFKCPTTCGSPMCKQISGHCTECPIGKYGSRCHSDCRYTCRNNICDIDHGTCSACYDGYYGLHCTKCPENCVSGSCDLSGHCTEGCNNDYYGNKCEKQCPQNCIRCIQVGGQCQACNDGYYGSTCTKCPENCVSGACDFSGRCTDGCVYDAYYGNLCELPCPYNCTSCAQDGGQCSACNDGNYGTFCERACGYCEGERCDKTTGDCAPCQTDWTGKRCDVRDERESGGEESNVAQSAGIGAGAVVAVIIIVVIIVIVIKRKSISLVKRTTTRSVTYENPLPTGNLTNNFGEMEEHVYLELENANTQDNAMGLENVYYNESPVGYAVEKIKTMIPQKMANDAKQFTSEFKAFPHGATHPHTIAEKNQPKNRYISVHPYDHSRVILDTLPGEIGSDYINASFIDNVEEKKLYVATQGPLQNTTEDFWRMVWTLNSGKIVMLTNLIENQKAKCHKYWPKKGDTMSTKTFNISLDREREYASYVIRDITVIDQKSKVQREIQQFHFTAWPDYGTPNALELVMFHRHMTRHETMRSGQIVIHCSAGIGRTGIFIALDTLLEYGKKHNRIDIRHFIHAMSKNRMDMVQTVDQYVFLHELLAEAFDLRDSLIPKSTFVAKYLALSTKTQTQDQTLLNDEFKLMMAQKPDYKRGDFQASLLPENQTKNRSTRILAVDKFKATMKSQGSNGNDYINAVIIKSYTEQRGYIVTQFPLPDTRTDFWTLVIEYQCDAVVILGDPTQDAHWQDAHWIPGDKRDVSVNGLKVKQKGKSTDFKGVKIFDALVHRKGEKNAHNVRIFQVKDWTMEREVPPSIQSMFHLLEQMESGRLSSDKTPVVITCMDGSTQCGLVCLVSNTLDQLKMDKEVDVLQAARQLLIRRPEFLTSIDQYQYCYTFLKEYLEKKELSDTTSAHYEICS